MTLILQKLSIALFALSVALAAAPGGGTKIAPITTPDSVLGQKAAIPPVMARIESCESTGDADSVPKQFNGDGSILWGWQDGIAVKRDCGIFQINTKAHANELEKLELDVCGSQADNETYAMILFQRNGTKDWSSSKSCWNK